MAIIMIFVGAVLLIGVIFVSIIFAFISNVKKVNTSIPPINVNYYEIESVDEQEIKPQTRICNYCGNEIKEKENKCSSCGASINKK